MDEVSHWAVKACDKLNNRINANKAFDNDEEALKKANLTRREMDGLELSKEFYPTIAVENYQALLFDCLTRLAGGDVAVPETTNFTGEFEPAKTKEELVDQYCEKFANPYKAAELGYIDEVIYPQETRKKIVQALEMLKDKVDSNPKKKHGNIPL